VGAHEEAPAPQVKPPRVVLDTNVVLSALIFREGRVAPLRKAWHDGRCRPLVSAPTTMELMRALQYPKFRLAAAERDELLADYLPYCAAVVMPASPPKVPACRDPYDLPFLELARAGKADFLVSGDADLHALADRFPVEIVSAARLLEILAGR